jgi:hypothetical protein
MSPLSSDESNDMQHPQVCDIFEVLPDSETPFMAPVKLNLGISK